MKKWINSLLHREERGYLTYSMGDRCGIIPTNFNYNKGHLIIGLSILNYDKINAIKKNKLVTFCILNQETEIILRGEANIDEDNLDRSELMDEMNDFEIPEMNIEELPHLSKRIILDIKPFEIVAKKGDKTVNYKLELV